MVLLLLRRLAGCTDKGVIHLVRMHMMSIALLHTLPVSNNKRLFVLFSSVSS
jgi:hypothetical protein